MSKDACRSPLPLAIFPRLPAAQHTLTACTSLFGTVSDLWRELEARPLQIITGSASSCCCSLAGLLPGFREQGQRAAPKPDHTILAHIVASTILTPSVDGHLDLWMSAEGGEGGGLAAWSVCRSSGPINIRSKHGLGNIQQRSSHPA